MSARFRSLSDLDLDLNLDVDVDNQARNKQSQAGCLRKSVRHKNIQVHDEVQVQAWNELRARQLCSSFTCRIELNQR
jgi:hypothetical protein